MKPPRIEVTGKVLFSGLAILVFISESPACEPAVPLGHLALFPGAVAKSIYLLIATVFVKTIAFVFLEKSLVWWQAMSFILLANIFTTAVGIVAAIPVSMTACLPLAIFSGLIAYLPAKGLAER